MPHPPIRPALLRVALLLALGGTAATSASAPRQSADRAVPAVMRHHFDAAGAMHDAIVRGDLAGVRNAATRLSTISRPPALPASIDTFVSGIARAALRAAEAGALPDAALEMVRILDQCGACHRASAVRITWPDVSNPPGEGLARHMRAYGVGLDTLLEGLVTPSDDRWRQGAERLTAASVRREDWPDNPLLRDRATSASARIRRLGEEARRARSPYDRSGTYAALIETCGGCHQHYPGLWGPGRP